MAAPKTRKFVCEIVKVDSLKGLTFSRSLMRSGFWTDKLRELAAIDGGVLKLARADVSSLTQIRAKAKAMNIELSFASDGDFVYIRLVHMSDEQAKLLLFVREARTINEIRAKGYQLNAEKELQAFASCGWVVLHAGKWTLTDQGREKTSERT